MIGVRQERLHGHRWNVGRRPRSIAGVTYRFLTEHQTWNWPGLMASRSRKSIRDRVEAETTTENPPHRRRPRDRDLIPLAGATVKTLLLQAERAASFLPSTVRGGWRDAPGYGAVEAATPASRDQMLNAGADRPHRLHAVGSVGTACKRKYVADMVGEVPGSTRGSWGAEATR